MRCRRAAAASLRSAHTVSFAQPHGWYVAVAPVVGAEAAALVGKLVAWQSPRIAVRPLALARRTMALARRTYVRSFAVHLLGSANPPLARSGPAGRSLQAPPLVRGSEVSARG